MQTPNVGQEGVEIPALSIDNYACPGNRGIGFNLGTAATYSIVLRLKQHGAETDPEIHVYRMLRYSGLSAAVESAIKHSTFNSTIQYLFYSTAAAGNGFKAHGYNSVRHLRY